MVGLLSPYVYVIVDFLGVTYTISQEMYLDKISEENIWAPFSFQKIYLCNHSANNNKMRNASWK